jgi:N,N'-diacetyllegionaminate synthase
MYILVIVKSKEKIFVIAEIGVNHDGSLNKAIKLIDEAVLAGANAVKFQTFIADNFILKKTKKTLYQEKNTSKKESHFDMIKKLELTKEDFYNINNYCLKKNIEFISTPYDVNSAIFLNKLKLKTFKISSADLSDILLHNIISSFGKRVILSTGMSTISDIRNALKFYKDKKKLKLLHCVSNYPCSYQSLNLNSILTLQSLFKLPVGFSDHTIDNKSAIIAYSLGARTFEKHFTLSKKSIGPDHASSITPIELKKYISDIYDAKLILGNFKKKVQKEELNMKHVSVKSITLNKNLKKHSIIKSEDINLKRPGNGLNGFFIKKIIGKMTKKNLKKNHQISLKDIF